MHQIKSKIIFGELTQPLPSPNT